jgi:hypothetical protein
MEARMKKLMIAAASALMMAGLVSGCTTAEQTGGLATGRTSGALAGALIGGTAGYLIGRSADRPGWCRYRDEYGRVYEARCR